MPNGRQDKAPRRGMPPAAEQGASSSRSRGLLSRQRANGGTPNAPAQADQNPFRPYHGVGEAAGPYLGPRGRAEAYGAPANMPLGWEESGELPAQRHHPFALFHDGNAGHLWRGEVANILGDTLLASGALMWLLAVTSSPAAIFHAVLALTLGVLLGGPLAVIFQNAAEPGVPLKWLGRARVVLVAGFIFMHFFLAPQNVQPAYALLFALSFLGRLRQGGRIAAERACLAPGEVEVVASDLHIGVSVAAVLGPLLGTALIVLGADHILLVAIGALICYLLSSNSESFLDALPPERRAFLHAQPLAPAANQRTPEDDEDEDEAPATGKARVPEDELADPALRRERDLPVWYVQGPRSIRQGIRDIRDGLGVVSTTTGGTPALVVIALCAFIGGGLATILLPYLVFGLALSVFELGPVMAAEGAGLALGASLFGARSGHARPAMRLALGLALGGVGLALLVILRRVPLLYLGALVYGFGGGIAVLSARRVLYGQRNGPEQRAVAATEDLLAALAAVVGALTFPIFTYGAAFVPQAARFARFFPGWPLVDTLLGAGLALLIAAVASLPLLSRKPGAKKKAPAEKVEKKPQYTTGRVAAMPSGRLGSGLDRLDEDEEGGDDFEDSRSLSAGGSWRGESRAWERPGGRRGPREYDDDAGSGYGPATGYDTGYGTGYGTGYQPGYGGRGGAYNDEDDLSDGGYGDDTGYRPHSPRRDR